MKQYDLIVIGSGGGTQISTPAANLGRNVAVVEHGPLGGTCLNRGCIPSKMLIHPADVAHEIAHADRFSINVDTNFGVRFEELVTRVNKAVTADSSSIKRGWDSHDHITLYPTTGRFVDKHVIQVADQQITADKIVIAAGSRPVIPPIEGLADTPFMTSTDALKNTKQPKKLIVIGGGYIAAELGHFFGALGTETHFLVRSRMVSREDGEVIDEFERVFANQYHVHFGISTTKVTHDGKDFTVHTKTKDGEQSTMTADALLVATGVTPNSDLVDVASAGIKTNSKGYITVDDHMRTNAEGVWAIGDIVGNYLFRHSVNFEGNYLFGTLFAHPSDEPIKYPPMPHAIFSNPQIGAVGATEEELKEQGVDYVVGKNSYKKSAMGMALRSESGFVKLLFDRDRRTLLGAHIIGPEASTMIHHLIQAMTMDATQHDLLRMIYIHPALPEIVRNAARNAKI